MTTRYVIFTYQTLLAVEPLFFFARFHNKILQETTYEQIKLESKVLGLGASRSRTEKGDTGISNLN